LKQTKAFLTFLIKLTHTMAKKWNAAPLPPPSNTTYATPQFDPNKGRLLTYIGQRSHDIREGIYDLMKSSPPPWTFTTDLFGLAENDVPLVLVGAFRDPLSCPANTPPDSLTVVIPLINKAKPKQDTMIYIWAVKAARTIFTPIDNVGTTHTLKVNVDVKATPPQPSPQLSTTTAMYRALVPPNCPPGTKFFAQAGGHTMELIVPDGAIAGTELMFPGPAPITTSAATSTPPPSTSPSSSSSPGAAAAAATTTVSGSQAMSGKYKYVDDKANGMKTLYIIPRLNPASTSSSSSYIIEQQQQPPPSATATAVHQDNNIPVAHVVEYEDTAPPPPAASMTLPRASVKIRYFMTDTEREAYANKLKAFYLKYEPKKAMEDIEDLILWVTTRPTGVEEMNGKLTKKYGANLDTIDANSKMSALNIRDVGEEHLDDLI
jgi:hypothetical protein